MGSRGSHSIDVVLVTPLDRRMAVLLVPASGTTERWALPWGRPQSADVSLQDSAFRVARSALPFPPTWLDQAGAVADGRRHPAQVDLSIAFVGTVPMGTVSSPRAAAAWFPVADLPDLAPRQRVILAAGTEALRLRIDYVPVAFRLLPPTFTLSDLQRVYEILLGHRVHKASFRRALRAAALVDATDQWRSEGRGRPARLFRYAPKRQRRRLRGLRFDLLNLSP
jgi:8-oxo-dGTP diphosphatase